MQLNSTSAYSLLLRVTPPANPEVRDKLETAIREAGGEIRKDEVLTHENTQELTIYTSSLQAEQQVARAAQGVEGMGKIEIHERTFALHDGGKLAVQSTRPLNNFDDLAMSYTPGVARVCMTIHDRPERSFALTWRRNTVAVVSDGTAVLGLGDIGPEAAMPVMEGKAVLFKEFGNVDAVPVCLATRDPEEIIATVKRLAPSFGAINLEDISAPRCFEIEERLKAELDIPVFHDDQHGTAVVLLAGLMNALKLTGRKIEELKVVVCGVGAAGVACSKIMMEFGATNIIGCDRAGAIYKGRTENMNSMKQWYADNTNPENETGSLQDVITGADMFIGLSSPGLLSVDDVKRMAPDPLIFAMANPVPEIMPEQVKGIAAVIATGRSDYPNQINNVLAFPGIFRGALDCGARAITEPMKLAAARAIAGVVADKLNPELIIPSSFDQRVAPAVAAAVRAEALRGNIARPDCLVPPVFAEIER